MFGWGRREKGGGYYHSAAAVGITGHAGLVDQDEIYSQVGDDHPHQLWSKVVQVWSKLVGVISDME